ncbi:hypothetical protein BKP35_10530 [Anaerobacillus arseniciselenatis]|uniref:Uncharacterized protein n=1 Tax=Anaerobacillus arseniciselenatis TaxID=85682 RepID=A0A1S2LMG3_9BACI|nr:hypothetical protein [Anaerobacillus arseniciselenatis]OIJ12615.1 hypothetical protein BKP35_10530 [Anaerobacillus arseniciselenatis]
MFSQAIFVPSVGIFLSAFQLSWKFKLLFTTYFVIIERTFLKLKIYNNKWWKTTYTAIFMFIGFFISDICYKEIKKGNKLMLKVTLYNTFHVLYMSVFFILSLFKKFRYEPVVLTKNPWYYHYTFVKLYLVFETCITVYFFEMSKKAKILPMFIIVLIDNIFINLKVLKVDGVYWKTLLTIRLFFHSLLLIMKKWWKI